MSWIFGISCYFALVWLFLRFFHFVAEVDEDIEKIQKNVTENHFPKSQEGIDDLKETA